MTRGEGTPNGMPAREQKKESKVHNRETQLTCQFENDGAPPNAPAPAHQAEQDRKELSEGHQTLDNERAEPPYRGVIHLEPGLAKTQAEQSTHEGTCGEKGIYLCMKNFHTNMGNIMFDTVTPVCQWRQIDLGPPSQTLLTVEKLSNSEKLVDNTTAGNVVHFFLTQFFFLDYGSHMLGIGTFHSFSLINVLTRSRQKHVKHHTDPG